MGCHRVFTMHRLYKGDCLSRIIIVLAMTEKKRDGLVQKQNWDPT